MSSLVRSESDSSTFQVIAAATAGDPAARWRALEACRDYLRLVVRRGRWSNKAGLPGTSDLVQKTMVDAWRGFAKFEGSTPGQFRAWLKAILVHTSQNARRRPPEAHIESGGDAGDVPGTATSPSLTAQKIASRQALDAALDGLPERHREAIHLRLWEQLSFAQVGARLGVSADGARLLYGRAVANLRALMRSGHDPG